MLTDEQAFEENWEEEVEADGSPRRPTPPSSYGVY